MFNTILVHPLLNLLAIIYNYLPLHDFGVSVIILTIVVRIILWPLVNRQLHSQRAQQKLQPDMARIKTQAKGDRQLEGKLMLELYKEKGINPYASLWPLVIQLPVFFALYAVLRDIIKPHALQNLAYPWVKHLPSITDIIHHGGTINPVFLGLNLSHPAWELALTAAVAQFVQSKQLAPKTVSNDPQARMMSSMIYFFPVITFVVGLSLPGALALYWTVSAAMAILQQTLILRRDVEEMEAQVDDPKKLDKKAKA